MNLKKKKMKKENEKNDFCFLGTIFVEFGVP